MFTLPIQEKRVNPNRKEIPVFISLASYPGGNRHKVVSLTIRSLLSQTVKPKKVLLWLYEEEFPKREKDLPVDLLQLEGEDFEIKWSQKNIKSYNKILNTLEEYPDEIIVTADDDIIYPKEWLERLWVSYEKYPGDIHTHRATFFYKENEEWKDKVITNSFSENPSSLQLFHGNSGVLYPPRSFYGDIFKEHLYINLIPNSDDVWLWAMLVLNNKKIRIVENNFFKLKVIPGTQEVSLYSLRENSDSDFIILINYYPSLKEEIEKEWKKVSNYKFP